MKYTKEQWAVELERRKAWDWSKTDCQLSRDHGVCRPCIQKIRIKLGIPPVVKKRNLKSAQAVSVIAPQLNETFQLPSRPGIYVWWNIVTNKRYVGQSRCVDKRYIQHLSMLRYGSHPNKHLQASFTKHGESAFHFLVVQQCGSVDQLNDAERHWINRFISTDRRFGYNLDDGGSAGKTMSQESVIKGSIARTGGKRSDESRLRMSLAKIGKKPTEKQWAQLNRLHDAMRAKRVISSK